MPRPADDALAAALAEVVGEALATPDVRVEGLQRLSGGASRETFAFDAVDASGARRPLILQRERPGGAIGTGGGTRTEAVLLRAAAAEGVPVPGVLLTGPAPDRRDAEAEGGPLGAAYVVVDRLEGETIPRRILRDDRYADARARLAAQCGRALAGIHAIPVEQVEGLHDRDQVAQFRDLMDALGEPHPAFELAFRWLESNRPPAGPTRVVHGDFRNGNLIIGPEGLRAVLDWELAHLGDPMEDLGWLCVKAWRFGGRPPVGGFGEYRELFDAYADAAGLDGGVDPAVVRWWEVLGTVKWGVMCIIQAASHLQGLSRSVELAAIGRRVCENEHDVLALLP
ncbi:MAG: phosphotransferase family protein [Acidimicrobiales bacterium]|nr:phosphotransferase family protein [Acidimicrobiales bacterium]MCB1014374.1 phosphotransferase family protein [Acidimicrobiales bacterium]